MAGTQEREQTEDGGRVRYPPSWKPEHDGDSLVGKVLGRRQVKTKYGMRSVLDMEDDDGEMWTLWASSKSLRDELNEIKPRVGDKLRVVFEGSGVSESSGFEFHNYKVELLTSASTADSDKQF